MPRRRNPTPNPEVSPVTVVKKASPFWAAVKYLGGGVVLGIAGYEGLRYWRKLKGESTEPVQLNPGHQQQAMGSAPIGLMPQMMPFPLPMPYPLPQMGFAPPMQPQAPVAPAFAPVERNAYVEEEPSPFPRRKSRRRLTKEEVQQLLEAAVEAEE